MSIQFIARSLDVVDVLGRVQIHHCLLATYSRHTCSIARIEFTCWIHQNVLCTSRSHREP